MFPFPQPWTVDAKCNFRGWLFFFPVAFGHPFLSLSFVFLSPLHPLLISSISTSELNDWISYPKKRTSKYITTTTVLNISTKNYCSKLTFLRPPPNPKSSPSVAAQEWENTSARMRRQGSLSISSTTAMNLYQLAMLSSRF